MHDFLSLYVNAYYYLQYGKNIFINIFGEEVIRIRLYMHSRQTVLQYASGTAHSLNLISFLLTCLLKIYSRSSTMSAASMLHQQLLICTWNVAINKHLFSTRLDKGLFFDIRSYLAVLRTVNPVQPYSSPAQVLQWVFSQVHEFQANDRWHLVPSFNFDCHCHLFRETEGMSNRDTFRTSSHIWIQENIFLQFLLKKFSS